MKKTTKSLLLSSLVLFCAGLLLAFGSALYAKIAKIDVYDFEDKARLIENKTLKLSDILTVSPDSNYVKKLSETEFNKIDIGSFTGTVNIIGGAKETKLVLKNTNTNNFSYQIVGDTLKLDEVDPVVYFGFAIDKTGFHFKGLRHLFHPGQPANTKKDITLYLSDKNQIENVTLQSTVGDINLTTITAEKINIKSGIGHITLKDFASPNAKISISGTKTDVTLDNSDYKSCNINTKFGSVDATLVKADGQSTNIDIWMGNANVKLDAPDNYYKLGLSTQMGSIYQNKKNLGKEANVSGKVSSRISSSIISGSFRIMTNGEKEKTEELVTEELLTEEETATLIS